jgi:2-oxoglutarate ferredoxin oxidoreductase subunit beta
MMSNHDHSWPILAACVPHAIRRNVDITYMIMDNEVFGLTKGQPSPTTPPGMLADSKASSMLKMAPQGVIETPLNIMTMILACGARFTEGGILNVD